MFRFFFDFQWDFFSSIDRCDFSKYLVHIVFLHWSYTSSPTQNTSLYIFLSKNKRRAKISSSLHWNEMNRRRLDVDLPAGLISIFSLVRSRSRFVYTLFLVHWKQMVETRSAFLSLFFLRLRFYSLLTDEKKAKNDETCTYTHTHTRTHKLSLVSATMIFFSVCDRVEARRIKNKYESAIYVQTNINADEYRMWLRSAFEK